MAKFTSALILFGICSLVPALSRADTFTVYQFASSTNTFIYGIDTAGDVLIGNGNPGHAPYEIYNGTTLVSSSALYPDFVTDNGGAAGGGRSLLLSVANGPYFAYAYVPAPGEPIFIHELYIPSPTDPPVDLFSFEYSAENLRGPVYINSVGDLAFTDLLSQVEVIHSSRSDPSAGVTPEPSTFTLLGSGLLGMAATLRRRKKLA